ncbi:carboxypeptidase-like regulatory domain-containing protein [archaeon]|nr:carboxypeptidase-like regulatory domain-containing protein [archaeon]
MFLAVVGVIAFVLLFPVDSGDNLQVTVLDSGSAELLSGATLNVYDSGNNLVTQQESAEGLASFDLKPGLYHINVSYEGYEERMIEVEVKSSKFAHLEVQISKWQGVIPSVCVENWTCTEWAECLDGVQSRACIDDNSCNTTTGKPSESQGCIVTCKNDAECSNNNPCTNDACLAGTCVHTQISSCVDGDLCCPVKCDHTLDSDCPHFGACETDGDCVDEFPCTIDVCSNSLCYHNSQTDCLNNDECCPLGCDSSTDNDCTNAPPTKDCSIDSDCSDWNYCTVDECKSGVCAYTQITSCSAGDSCCPQGCDYLSDADCDQCGSDGDCVPEDPCLEPLCTFDDLVGATRCVFRPINLCNHGDGCCPLSCFPENDDDCVGFCQTRDDCDDDDPCTQNLCLYRQCVFEEITECGPFEEGIGCCPPGCEYNPGYPNHDPNCEYSP